MQLNDNDTINLQTFFVIVKENDSNKLKRRNKTLFSIWKFLNLFIISHCSLNFYKNDNFWDFPFLARSQNAVCFLQVFSCWYSIAFSFARERWPIVQFIHHSTFVLIKIGLFLFKNIDLLFVLLISLQFSGKVDPTFDWLKREGAKLSQSKYLKRKKIARIYAICIFSICIIKNWI